MTRISAVINTHDTAFQTQVTRLLRTLGVAVAIVDDRQLQAAVARGAEFQSDAVGAQEDQVALVHVHRDEVAAVAGARVRRALHADHGTEGGVPGLGQLGEGVAARLRAAEEKAQCSRKSSRGPFGTICVGLSCFMLR